METPCGNIRVAIQGDRMKPAILTVHDIGLNRKFSCDAIKMNPQKYEYFNKHDT